MNSFATKAKTPPRFAIHVFRPGGAKYGVYESWMQCEKAAIESVKRKVYKEGRLAHFYRYVAVDLKIQS